MKITAWDKDERAAYSRVWLDGEEVTPNCFSADDETGEVGLYVRGPAGIESDEEGKPKAVYKRGKVEIAYGVRHPTGVQ